jgi:hypothetical protein
MATTFFLSDEESYINEINQSRHVISCYVGLVTAALGVFAILAYVDTINQTLSSAIVNQYLLAICAAAIGAFILSELIFSGATCYYEYKIEKTNINHAGTNFLQRLE